MADRPIIFSAPMIAALLAGRKTQTRRILKPQPPADARYAGVHYASYEPSSWFFNTDRGSYKVRERFEEGDRLWVRENHQFRGASYNDGTEGDPNWSEDEWFRVWGCGGPGDSWDPEFRNGWSPSMHMGVHDLVGPEHDEGPDVRGFATKVLPSIHMPRWASRLTLLVTDVRVERLQDISEEDAVAEGLKPETCAGQRMWDPGPPHGHFAHPQVAYRVIWEDIHGPGSWDANPWIVAVTFSVHARNIDQLAPIAEVAA